MNWIREVCGAFILDINDKDWSAVFADANRTWKSEYKQKGLDAMLFCPQIGNPMNMLDAYLRKKFSSLWTDAFLAASASPTRLMKSTMPVFTELLHCAGILYITYTYQ
jgi:hypothetical protein